MFRFLFWFTASVIMAYFMTDIRIGNKNIKEHIDHFLSTQSGINLQNKAKELIGLGADEVIKKIGESQTAPKGQEQVVVPPKQNVKPEMEENMDELNADDKKALMNIIKQHD
jgi:hypothetical protein